MYPEFIEGFHYVGKCQEPVIRETCLLSDRLEDQNLWEGCDWHHYYAGVGHADLGIPKQSENPFYCKGYEEGRKKYLSI